MQSNFQATTNFRCWIFSYNLSIFEIVKLSCKLVDMTQSREEGETLISFIFAVNYFNPNLTFTPPLSFPHRSLLSPFASLVLS